MFHTFPPCPLHSPFCSEPCCIFQDAERGRLLMAATATHNAKPCQPPSVIHYETLNHDPVYSFDLLCAQQTPAGIYPLIVYFSSSGPVIRMKCGNDGCRSTANPTDTLPILVTTSSHHTANTNTTWFLTSSPSSPRTPLKTATPRRPTACPSHPPFPSSPR